eukprot:65981_1
MSKKPNLQFDLSNKNGQISETDSLSLNHNLSHGVGTIPIEMNFEAAINKLNIKFDESKRAASIEINFVPHIKSSDGNKCITSASLDMIKDGKYTDLFDNYVIIDCRYDYEYNAGHIKDALNIQSADLLELLMKSNLSAINNSIAWIFHCEYSQKRGPRAASFFRNIDARLNQMTYPNLCFPHCYVLEGGYKGYYNTNHVSNSLTYVSMFDAKFKSKCITDTALDQKHWRKGKKFKKGKRKKKRRAIIKIQVPCPL